MICATEQHVTILENIYDEVKAEFANSRCYFLNKDEADKVAKVFFNAKTHGVNANAFGRSCSWLKWQASLFPKTPRS